MSETTDPATTDGATTQDTGPVPGSSAARPGGADQAGTRALHTRLSATWGGVVLALVVLVLLVIFIAENTQRATVNYLGFHGQAPASVVILIAALAGAVIVVVIGATRILQLRRAVRHPGRRSRRAHSAPARNGKARTGSTG